MSRVLGVTGDTCWPGPWAADPAGAAIRARNPQKTRGGLVGVVWGEGEAAANQQGPAAGVDIPGWIERLIRAVWRRLFVHGGEA